MIYSYVTTVGGRHGLQHKHDFHEFFFCLSPSAPVGCELPLCTHYIQHSVVPTFMNDLIFLPAGQGHVCVCNLPQLCPCIVFYFTDDELSPTMPGDSDAFDILRALLQFTSPGRNRMPLTEATSTAVRSILYELAEENIRKSPGWRCALKHHYMRLLLTIYRGWTGAERLGVRLERAEPGERMQDVIRFINLQYMNPIGVEDLLRISCLSRSHFHAIFKNEIGQTFKEYLNNVRINNAKNMLTQTDMPIAQIALACGFSSQSRFNTVFRALLGYPPGRERTARYPK